MKKYLIFILVLFFTFNCYAQKDPATEMDEKSRVTIKKNSIPGYVFFDGFDFKGYKPETGGIVPMLQRTHELLRANYAANRQPFVFVGHSQGGLRALAMSTKRGVS